MMHSITLALAVASLAAGTEAAAQQDCAQRTSLWFIKGQADQRPLALRVAGGAATTLVFDEAEVASAQLAGDAGKRFRALEAGKHAVVIIPRQDLADGEHISLAVTLKDGTEIPFDLASPPNLGPNGQVDVFLNQENIEAVRRDLQLARSKIEALSVVNVEYQIESDSPEYALATLLAQGREADTPFVLANRKMMNEAGADLAVLTFRPEDGKPDVGKAAVVFEVTNKNPKELWKLDDVRLTSATTGARKTFAVRASASVLGAGQKGRVAVVFDSDLFGTGRNTDRLLVELWRAGHVRQAYVELAEADDDARPVLMKVRRTRAK